MDDRLQFEIIYHEETSCWKMQVPCTDCGGYPLQFPSLYGAKDYDEVLGLSSSFEQALSESERCLGCLSHQMRSGSLGRQHAPYIWFDTVNQEWYVWQPVTEEDGISLPLGVGGFFTHPLNILAAARDPFTFNRVQDSI